ncbi:MAG: S41 family peptidase [Candidatus Delongbacteria bacterium]|nr:S41 family peptidase [Candidatus Delongbacteria bacterium]
MKLMAIVVLAIAVNLSAFEPFFIKDPAISPDGNTVCFSYKKDLWIVPFDGGTAKRLTSVVGDDTHPSYSPDGRSIAFNSEREGYDAVYYIPAGGGRAKKVISGNYTVTAWYKDSDALLLMGGERYVGNKLFRVNLDGSGLTDLNSIGFVYGDLSKEDDKFVFCHRGDPFREKMTGSGSGSLHLLDFATDSYYKIYDGRYTERYPVYSKTGNGIYFAGSDGERFQIFLLPQEEIGKQEPRVEQLTNFDWWSARDISIARENDRMVYEYFDGLWMLDPALKKAEKIEIDIKEDLFGPDTVNDINASSTDAFCVSPLGNWILYKYKFDLFAVPYEGGEIKRITSDANGISDFVISSDNETVYFTSLRSGEPRLFKTGIRSSKEPEMLSWSREKSIERLKYVKGRIFVFYSEGEDRNRLAVISNSKDEFTDIEKEKYVNDAEVSADGNYIFYSVLEPGLFRTDLYMYDLKQNKKEMLYSGVDWTSNFMLDPKEEFVFYNKGGVVYRSDMKNISEFHFEKDKWKDIFEKKDKKKKAEKEPEMKSEFFKKDLNSFEVELIKKPGFNYIISLNKNREIYYINDLDNNKSLRKTDYQAEKDELVTELKGNGINDLSFCDSTSTVFYLQEGRIKSFEIVSKKFKDTPFTMKYDYNRQEIYWKVFDELHSVFKRWFYDPDMHGADWTKLKTEYSNYLNIGLDSDSFASIIDEMVGDLNSSHTGYYPVKEPGPAALKYAYIGAEFDLVERLLKGLKIKRVLEGSALKTVHNIEAGDIITSVDGIEITPLTDIHTLFINKTGEKIRLDILKKDGKMLNITIKGLESDYQMKYRTWVSERHEMVDSLSAGRIGYVHIQGMSEGPLQKFKEDLFSETFGKEAVIIDVRYNGGGYTHDDLIEILTKKQYAYSAYRWNRAQKLKAPFDIWDKPSVVLINPSSFSDAEIFPAIYREMGLGKIIGTPTTGGVIGTGQYTLIDGSSMRLPRVGWYKKDGTNMEGNGVEPDIYVEPTFNQLINGDDPEIKKAVELMLEAVNN